ncbi:MAG: carotenoid oxygenase family protein, partial [Acidimicrobiia bacterium]
MTIASERPVATIPKWAGGFETLTIESEYPITRVEGEIPKTLHGTLFRVGPAAHEIAGIRYRHWFDGDGMASAIVFRDGKASFRNRYVQTAGRLREQAAGKPLYAGYGTRLPDGTRKNVGKTIAPKNAANTNVVYHGCRLLALWEGGRPYELEAATLNTLGEYDFSGAIEGRAFSAHPKVMPGGEMINFGVSHGPRTLVHLYSVAENGQLSSNAEALPLPFEPFLH